MKQVGYVALGSNIEPRLQNLQEALLNLQEASVEILGKSAVYETKAYGYTQQGDFLNAVVKIATSLTPEELLQVTQGIEKKMKRKKIIHWGPRNIDLDLLLLGEETRQTLTLVLPHKELTKRSFVLVPLKDVYEKESLLGKRLDQWIKASGNLNEVKLFKKEW